jgi:hypothetical protein
MLLPRGEDRDSGGVGGSWTWINRAVAAVAPGERSGAKASDGVGGRGFGPGGGIWGCGGVGRVHGSAGIGVVDETHGALRPYVCPFVVFGVITVGVDILVDQERVETDGLGGLCA